MGRIADMIASGVSMPEGKRRQMLKLDEQFSALEAEVQILRTQKRNLEAEVNPLKKMVERLENRIKQQAAPPRSLDATREGVLRLLSEHPNRFVEEIAGFLQISEEAVKFHLEALQEMDMVNWGLRRGSGYASWHLEQAGREYLHAKGWLK